MEVPLGVHDLALLASIVGPDIQKQAEHAARLLRKALNRQPDKDLLKEFEDFWSAYPRKVAVGAARSSYVRARGKVDAGTILRGLAAYNLSVRGKETKFITHASTWLNQERWTDEQPATGSVPEVARTIDPYRGERGKIEHFLKTGRWVFRGSPPTDPTTLVPKEILREYQSQFNQKGWSIPALAR